MAGRESVLELLGVAWPEPEERTAQGRSPVGGARERPWKQQDEARAGWPRPLRVAESSGADGIPSCSEQSVAGRLRPSGQVGGPGERRGKCSSKTFQFYSFRDSLELFALLSLHVPTSKQTCSESKLA